MKHAFRFSMVLMLIFGLSSMASAYQATFFGEDEGLGESTRLTTWANASAAEAQFKANLIGIGTETFESYGDNTYAPLAISFGSAGTATINGTGYVNQVTSGTNGVGRYPISGTKYWETGSSFYIDFSAPVAAFGFYGIDIGDFDGQVTVTLSNGETVFYNVGNSTEITGGSVLYWGVIDTERLFTRVAFGNTEEGTDFFGFDDMTIGSREQVVPSPEPTTMLLLGLGVLGLAGLRKRN
jgi:hypothetical protein